MGDINNKDVVVRPAKDLEEATQLWWPLQPHPAMWSSVFIIDPKKVVRATITYPASTGRNFDEILRLIAILRGNN